MSARPQPDPFDDLGFDADDEFSIPEPAGAFPAQFDPPAGQRPQLQAPSPAMAPAARALAQAVSTLQAVDLAAPSAPLAQAAGNPVGALIAQTEAALGDVAVPRITIHIFCERPDTAETAQRAATDRRLARASTVVRQGGLAEALQVYQSQPTPPLLIVESGDHPHELLAGLERLAEVCDPGTKVVVIGAHNDIHLYRELMRRGVSEYLVPPVQVLGLIRAVCSLYADPATPFVGRSLAFIGAKGGVGSSTLAHNVAWLLSERLESNTVVVDYDLPFGTAGLNFNQDPVQGVADALSQPDRLDPVLLDRMTSRCSERLSLFAAPASLDDDYAIDPEAFEEVTAKIRTTAPYVVLDLPHLWSGWIRTTLHTADEVVITASPDLASLRNAKNIVDLARRTRANDNPPLLVLNQVGVPNRPEIPVKEFAKALGLEPALVLPFDPKLFGQAANNGQMLQEVQPKAKAVEGLAQFAQTIARREAPAAQAAPAEKAKSLFDRFLKRG